ncbi:MAG: deoxyribodipyrimidine photo-lyase, partial [Rhodococcus sp. (in: high G+C Gram-positive bacteria)]
MSLVWFRRDLRLGDLPTLTAAAESGDPVLGLFVLDDRLLKPSGGPRKDFLFRSLEALNEQLDGRLMVVHGDPESVVPKVAKAIDADEVHISADYGPYGRERDQRVGEKVTLVETGSPYAVAPGRITKNDGEPYKVFTPYSRQWMEHGWRGPADTSAKTVTWIDPDDVKGVKRAKIPSETETSDADAGEKAALAQWK